MRDVLEMLIAASGLDVEVRLDPERLRPSDVPAMVGDPRKLREAGGWEPRFTLERSLADLLQHWREQVGVAALARPRH